MQELDEPALMAQSRGFAGLRFSQALEPGFLHYMHVKMAGRARLVAISAISFMLFFMWLDVAYLPEEILPLTLGGRLLALLLICFALWYSNRPEQVAAKSAFLVSACTYAVTGIIVSLVIVLARVSETRVPVTHDGLYLILFCGLFLIGLPARHAVLGSWMLVLGFLLASWIAGTGRVQMISNGLFLMMFTLIGSIGAYMYEHMLRSAYLSERLLDAARQRAERESQGKTRFLATASHDLRQPLHAMSLFIQHLDEQVTQPQARQTIARLSESAELLQQMLNALLDMSRLSAGMVKPQFKRFNLQPFLQRIIDSLEHLALPRGVSLELLCPVRAAVLSDPVLLERLLRNFLNNALVHASATRIRLEVTPVEDRLRLAVVDDGCGMAEEDQQRIYEEFTQLRNPARTLDKGVGLGLSICRQLLHLLEYPSGLLSRPGQGARFWFDVPQAEWREEIAEPTLRAGRLAGRVLVVENDRINREALSALLSQWGCSVQAFADPQELLQLRPFPVVDLLLSDYRLEGDLDGLQLIRALRSAELYSGPALLLTADTSDTLTEQARLADVEMLYKPVLPARLRRQLQPLLGGTTG
ncbi:MAG: hybrid sensor histidine kinase/response regulator [Halopseudomonas yangmingensis]